MRLGVRASLAWCVRTDGRAGVIHVREHLVTCLQVVACPPVFEKLVGAAFKADGVRLPSAAAALELAEVSQTADSDGLGSLADSDTLLLAID